MKRIIAVDLSTELNENAGAEISKGLIGVHHRVLSVLRAFGFTEFTANLSTFIRDFRETAAQHTRGCIVLERPDLNHAGVVYKDVDMAKSIAHRDNHVSHFLFNKGLFIPTDFVGCLLDRVGSYRINFMF